MSQVKLSLDLLTLGQQIELARQIAAALNGNGNFPVPIGPLPAPENLSATAGDMPGEVDLHWNRVCGASSYVLQYTTDPMSNASVWTTCPPSTKSKCIVPNLTAGTRYWFRVAAAGAAGQGPWSDPATKMAQ